MCKGHTHKGHREKVLNVMNFRVFSGYFQGVFGVFSGSLRKFQESFRAFSGCFQGVFGVFSGCFRGIFREFQEVSGCFQGVFVFFPMPFPGMHFVPVQT